MAHGHWDGHHKALFEERDNHQATDHTLRIRVKRLRAALIFIRDHDANITTRLYAEGALEGDEVLT